MGKQIKYRDGYKYQLVEPYIVQTSVTPREHIAHDFIILATNGVLMIKAGYAWDGPSGPTVDTKSFMRGSLVHDAIYQLMRSRHLDVGWRETADNELVRICKEDGMWSLRRWWVLRAVRLAGESGAKWQVEETLTAP
jgi:hypothetical protein